MQDESEKQWFADKEAYGWELPPKAHWALRLPIVRWFRWQVHRQRVEEHYAVWEAIGALRTGYDNWVLYAISRGWC